MKKRTRNSTTAARDRAREFRGGMNASESILWGYLRHERLGLEFRRQYPAGSFFLDFYCREASLAVEVDGEHHQARKGCDEARDAWLASRGIEVIRLPSLDLFEETSLELGAWLARIQARCEVRSGRSVGPHPPAPSPRTSHLGEGEYSRVVPNDNYQSASEMIRSLDKIRVPYELLDTQGPFRLLRFSPPYWDGYEFWLVNEKGFMWEPGESLDSLRAYLAGDEAREYMENLA